MNEFEVELARRLHELGRRHTDSLGNTGSSVPRRVRVRVRARQLALVLGIPIVLAGASVAAEQLPLGETGNSNVAGPRPATQSPVESPRGWPQVTLQDPDGPYVDGYIGEEEVFEQPRAVLASGTVSYKGRTGRWSYTTFTIRPDLEPEELSPTAFRVWKIDLEAPEPGTNCVEYLDEMDDGGGGSSLACGDAIFREGAFSYYTLPGGGPQFPGLPFYIESRAVPPSTDRVTIELDDGATHDLPIARGPAGSDLSIFVGFLPRVDKEGVVWTIRTIDDGQVTSAQQVCSEPSYFVQFDCERWSSEIGPSATGS